MFGCAKKKAVAATATAGPLTKTLWQQLQVADELPCEGTLSMLLFKGIAPSGSSINKVIHID